MKLFCKLQRLYSNLDQYSIFFIVAITQVFQIFHNFNKDAETVRYCINMTTVFIFNISKHFNSSSIYWFNKIITAIEFPSYGLNSTTLQAIG